MRSPSIRYGGGTNDVRSMFLKVCGFLQGKEVVVINSNPKVCGEVLAASETKGTFIEHLIATPAWSPILSTESVDGEQWKNLSQKFKVIIGRIRWRERVNSISKHYIHQLQLEINNDPKKVIDAEAISRITSRILYELLFETPISNEDEDLFYEASLEWRKEIGMKGRGNPKIKKEFWRRLSEIFDHSSLSDLLEAESDREFWLSSFAQPFIISPQINISDIMVASFHYLRADTQSMDNAKKWALEDDKARLGGILLEAIRLKHPFPILEREVEKGTEISGLPLKTKTQFFLLFDQFQQDFEFNPERWLPGNKENPYQSVPFGAGPRSCIGKPIAMEILTELLRSFLTGFQIRKVQPQLGHLYSGRDNDSQTGLKESIYQLKTISRAVWRSWVIGRKNITAVESTGCPWKKTMQYLKGQ